jgi:hypothetical protein
MVNPSYDQAQADKLLGELTASPDLFKAQGKALILLEQFFLGLPLIHLHSLFLVSDASVLRTAVWIASELADGIEEFLDEAIALHEHPDRWIRHHSDNIIARATVLCRYADFSYVLDHLEDRDKAVMGDALRFFVNAGRLQLEGALSRYAKMSGESASIHQNSLRAALNLVKADPEDLRMMVQDTNKLQNLYGAGIAIRNTSDVSAAGEVLNLICNHDVSHAVERILRIRGRTNSVNS